MYIFAILSYINVVYIYVCLFITVVIKYPSLKKYIMDVFPDEGNPKIMKLFLVIFDLNSKKRCNIKKTRINHLFKTSKTFIFPANFLQNEK